MAGTTTSSLVPLQYEQQKPGRAVRWPVKIPSARDLAWARRWTSGSSSAVNYDGDVDPSVPRAP
jgi:hypothetical protein